ncbi:uncharacterized protein LOC120700503 [Panicum virgatum]|uniref:uncharacterized protein LOC120693994 n=1 Tax=Panicum virgatum TaxID=38727 RepID=UPI0019D68B5F|nr:uncharacterized protein LOC120693994 [Panicum virgatum]XP_039840702.1 uncharacterized protein LOC120700503 [Panicum virgatum]
MLLNYRPSTPPLADADHHLPNTPQHCLGELPSFCCRKSGNEPFAARVVLAAVDWTSARRTCTKEWLKNPMSIALLLWLLCVGVSGGMLVLLLLGLLDGAFPAPAERKRWVEINNQVLNALFTLMSIYQHPALCHHLFLLCRWRPHDAADLRAAYCKSAAPRAGERAHMAVVVALLHLTVACQYVLCGFYWGYTKTTRPELGEDGFLVLGVVAPVAAAVYTMCSPLGKDGHELGCSNSVSKTQSQMQPTSSGHGHVVVIEPEWAGGMFDFGGGDTSSAWCLSLPCTFFCVFGWNLERLGFGNAYVHAVTFALLCLAPLWVLGVSALHIRDRVIGDMVGGAGVVLCACGLLYGGYWRIQMRKRFGLPGSRACCGSKSLTDYVRWLLCWPCALAQEVRTANLYHVDGEILYSKVDDGGHEERQPLLLVPCSDDHDETTTMAPPVVHQVVVVQVEDEKPDECSSVLHSETVNSSIPTSVMLRKEYESLSESSRAMLNDYDRRLSSAGNWRLEKVKKLINMVTLLSLLIILYTRGIIL